MRLYHVVTTYHLLSAMTMQMCTDEKAVLLMATWVKLKYPDDRALKINFSDVIEYDGAYRYQHSREETNIYFQRLLPDIASFNDIYIWGAQYSFGVFAAENSIPFIFCEEATGMHSRRSIVEHIDEKDPKLGHLYAYVSELGLYSGNCSSAKTVLCNFAAQIDGTETEGFIDFSVVDGLMALPTDKRQEIIAFFIDLKELHIPPDSTVIFTQHFANLRLTTFEEQVLLYQLFVDYFFENCTLVIKPHPDDMMYYSKLFPEAQIMRERFPSEFLPFLVDHAPECVATVYSTAVYNLRGHYPEVFELDARYERDFIRTHRYYAALMIANKLNVPAYYVGTNEILMEKLGERIGVSGCACKNLSQLPAGDGAYTVIVDDLTEEDESGRDAVRALLQSAGKDINVIFLNTQSDYCWYSIDSKELWAHMIPVALKKRLREDASSEDFYESLQEEILYVYSLSDRTLKEVNELSFEKQLPHVGINVEKIPLTEDEERLKMLEGILEATEQRLLYYINRVKELEKK